MFIRFMVSAVPIPRDDETPHMNETELKELSRYQCTRVLKQLVRGLWRTEAVDYSIRADAFDLGQNDLHCVYVDSADARVKSTRYVYALRAL